MKNGSDKTVAPTSEVRVSRCACGGMRIKDLCVNHPNCEQYRSVREAMKPMVADLIAGAVRLGLSDTEARKAIRWATHSLRREEVVTGG